DKNLDFRGQSCRSIGKYDFIHISFHTGRNNVQVHIKYLDSGPYILVVDTDNKNIVLKEPDNFNIDVANEIKAELEEVNKKLSVAKLIEAINKNSNILVANWMVDALDA